MKNLRVLPLTFLATAILFVAARSVFAESNLCYGPYGEIIPCPIIDKSFNVQKTVVDGEYLVDELRGVNNAQLVPFSIVFKNTGELKVQEFIAVDSLPADLEFVSLKKDGNTVNVKVEGQSVSWEILNFNPGQSIEFFMITKANTNGIAENSEKCVINVANGIYKGKVESSNTASVCIVNPKGEVKGDSDKPGVLPDTALDESPYVGIAIIGIILGLCLLSLSYVAKQLVAEELSDE